MTQYLPPNLLALFAPRDPVPFLPPPDKLPHEKKTRGYLGVGNFLECFEVSDLEAHGTMKCIIGGVLISTQLFIRVWKQEPKDTPPPTKVETREERMERRRREKAEQVAYKLEREIAIWDPHKITECTEDPFKTLFVARVVSQKPLYWAECKSMFDDICATLFPSMVNMMKFA